MSDAKFVELENRIRALEEQLEQARLAHNETVAVYRERHEKQQQWNREDEVLHEDINEYLRALSQKVFPKQDQFWEEADRILKSSPRAAAKPVEQPKPIQPAASEAHDEWCLCDQCTATHDKWCLCPTCQAKVAEEARLDGERVLAETGHQKWCSCEPCLKRRREKSEKRTREDRIKNGFDPDDMELPEIDPNALQNNPFSNAPQPFITNDSLPKPPRKAPAHEPHCICLECVRWRGMGKRKK